jgi:oligopeptide/dipeptide ABC transporter ATP-binding protein
MGVVARMADRITVMYAGRICETAPAADLFRDPQHPYTRALLRSMPRLDDDLTGDLPSIGGQPPNLALLPPGCAFAERCAYAQPACLAAIPPLRSIGTSRWTACRRDVAEFSS